MSRAMKAKDFKTPASRTVSGIEIFTVRRKTVSCRDGVHDEILSDESTEYIKRSDYERELAAAQDDALEEAAKECDEQAKNHSAVEALRIVAECCAYHIRARKTKP